MDARTDDIVSRRRHRDHVRILSAEGRTDPRTAARWMRGERMIPSVDAALSAAAARLGIARETSATPSSASPPPVASVTESTADAMRAERERIAAVLSDLAKEYRARARRSTGVEAREHALVARAYEHASDIAAERVP